MFQNKFNNHITYQDSPRLNLQDKIMDVFREIDYNHKKYIEDWLDWHMTYYPNFNKDNVEIQYKYSDYFCDDGCSITAVYYDKSSICKDVKIPLFAYSVSLKIETDDDDRFYAVYSFIS